MLLGQADQTVQWLSSLNLFHGELHIWLDKAPKFILVEIQPCTRTAIKTNYSKYENTSDEHKCITIKKRKLCLVTYDKTLENLLFLLGNPRRAPCSPEPREVILRCLSSTSLAISYSKEALRSEDGTLKCDKNKAFIPWRKCSLNNH